MDPTQQSLAERMQLHELEIVRRKQLLGFTTDDAACLARARPFIVEDLDWIVEEFYRHQTSIAEVALIIGDSETLRRLRAAQRGYIADLFSGYYAEDYVNNRLRIGLVHKRIGVAPKYYLSAVKVLKDLLRDVLRRRMSDRPTLVATLEAVDKLLYFDTQLVFDTHFATMRSELEAAKDQTLKYAQSLEQKVTERTRELEALSRADPLTGLLNRRALIHDLRKEIERAKRTGTVVSLVYFDLDRFKQVNDRKGHHEGDKVLQRIGQALRGLVREVDIAGRYGGDEFCVVLPGSTRDGALQLVERLRERFAGDADMTFSMGIVETGPVTFQDLDDLLRMADRLMYEMKASHQRQRRHPSDTGGRRDAASEAEDAGTGPHSTQR